jgi:hypothetical protein
LPFAGKKNDLRVHVIYLDSGVVVFRAGLRLVATRDVILDVAPGCTDRR